MDAQVLKAAFDDALLWGCGLGLVGIALAALALGLARFPARVRAAVQRYGLPAVLVFGGFVAVATVTGAVTHASKARESATLNDVSATLNAENKETPCLPSSASFVSSESNSTARTLSDEDFDRGLVLTRVGTNETFDFSAPADATVCADWRAFGAAHDWVYLAFTNWAFSFGADRVTRLRVHSDGWVEPFARDAGGNVVTNLWLAPFRASLGLMPEANGPRISTNLLESVTIRDNPWPNAPGSIFWHLVTPSNTLQLTWHNGLLNRAAATPVSFQAELWPNGRFAYRYGLSRLDVPTVTNALVGVSLGGPAWAADAVPTNVTSFAFHPLTAEDAANPDRDGDGLTLTEELFVYRTDPERWDTDCDGLSDGEEIALGTDPLSRDTDGDGLVDGSDPEPLIPTSLDDRDGDGIPDAYEIFWFGGTNAVDSAERRDGTGFTLRTKMDGGVNPTNDASIASVISAAACVSWRLFGAFAAPSPASPIVWERTFTVNRTSAWQQLFVSADPTNAAPWRLEGTVLEWETNTGTSGAAARAPFGDSFRIPLAADDRPTSLTLRLRATGESPVVAAMPLHLIAYVPEFRFAGGSEITGQSGAKFFVFTDGADAQIRLVVDHARRPHKAKPGADECDWSVFSGAVSGGGDFSFTADGLSGGTVTACRPGIWTLPDVALDIPVSALRRTSRARSARQGGGRTVIVLDPSVGWNCRGHGCACDGLGYDWHERRYCVKDDYPLDSACLRRKWYRDWQGGWSVGDCTLSVSSGIGANAGCVTTLTDGSTGRVFVDGVEVWSGSAEHVYDAAGCGDGYHEDFLGDGCDACETDCADGTCDALEGPTLGSLRFRVPLGSPVKGQVAGFAWFASDGPVAVSKSTFRLLAHPSATVTDTTASGTRRVVCTDPRGRDLHLADIANGVRVTILDTAAQTLEHTWEIVNVNGDPSRVRLRKISRLGNVMSDETFTYADGNWTQFDSIAGVETRLWTYDGFAKGDDSGKSETRTTTDAEGNVLASVTTERSRVGTCENAVLRETYRSESMGLISRWSQADYWDDPAHAGRHGQPRLVWGNARAWVYADFDGNGHEILRIEQRNGAEMPQGMREAGEALRAFGRSLAATNLVSGLVSPPASLAACDAFVTVRDYSPLAGDSVHPDDAARPRIETRYVVANGVVTPVGRTWTRYTRLSCGGYAVVKRETWRAAGQGAEQTDAGNAYSCEITFADTGEGTPLLMRGAVVEALDENGLRTVNAYALTNGILVCETRKQFVGTSSRVQQPSSPVTFPTYEVTERDARYGTVLRRTTRLTADDTAIADEQSVYDDQNRLRATTYMDGTSLTNAYSCCRLLWTRDREGRKTLRSAQTGTDHLYHAMEDVWLGEIGSGEQGTGRGATNKNFRVTQHFFDALGRETNTVVYAGTTPGEATTPTGGTHSVASAVTTAYPYGGSGYAVHTDVRGSVTVRNTNLPGDGIETDEAVFTNGVEVMRTKSRAAFGGGSSTRREWAVGRAAPCPPGAPPLSAWTEERRFDEYAADGHRVAYVVTESSDCGIVTNAVTTYDWLGREVASETPLSSVTYVYDGSSSRIFSATDSKSDVTTVCLYGACGEPVGTAVNGVTRRSDVSYETDASNVTWRVTTERTFAAGRTNACTVTRERLTGLSDALRSHVEIHEANGPQTVERTSFDAATGLVTETRTSTAAPSVVRRTRYGLAVEQEASGETSHFDYDAFGRNVRVARTVEGVRRPVSAFAYDAADALVTASTYTNDTDTVTETYEYGALGRRVAVTDALGQVVRTAYDAVGNVVAEDGATYPVCYGYDTAGRRTSLATTRDGATWDVTRWSCDAATGLCAAKTYADGSTVAYTHTPDGLPLRTTYASGRWTENVYDSKRQSVGRHSSDGSDDAAFARDAFGRLVSSSNGIAAVERALADCGTATNEAWTVGGESATLARELDAQGRLAALAGRGGALVRALDAQGRLAALAGRDGAPSPSAPSPAYAQRYAYGADGRLAAISNAEAVVTYAYTPDGLDAGYTLALANEMTFTRTVVRDPFRRDLVARIENRVNGAPVESLAYAYDALARPVTRNGDAFGYNARGEVVFSRGDVENAEEAYAYDHIGNAVLAASGGVTNAYAANALNQYASILRASVSPCETIPQYDTDGNLMSDGAFAYSYDAANRLVTVSSNGVLLVTNFYDAQSRRVRKATPEATATCFYDGWNLIEERVTHVNGANTTIRYYWGKDISGTPQGAGGIGGLLYLTVNGTPYVPFYDNNGNVAHYCDASGSVAATYKYDAFGKTIAQSGPRADLFRHRFSTKCLDAETGLYYYGYRFYAPSLMRWLNRDPIEEDGGVNLYGFCGNNSIALCDYLGRAHFEVRALSGLGVVLSYSCFAGIIGVVPSLILDFGLANSLNIEILHEHLFYDDGTNVGYGEKREFSETTKEGYYRRDQTEYDDCVMKDAAKRIPKPPYSLLGLGRPKYNCQDYADALRREYYKLLNDKEIRCKCGISK